MPGFKEIQTLHEQLLSTREFSVEPQRSWILPLHSLLIELLDLWAEHNIAREVVHERIMRDRVVREAYY